MANKFEKFEKKFIENQKRAKKLQEYNDKLE